MKPAVTPAVKAAKCIGMNTLVLLMVALFFGARDDAPAPIDDQHLVLYGTTVEMLYGSETEANAPAIRVLVYKEGELFTAFKSNEKGEYVFNLPIGDVYELHFGGESFVNKRVIIDTRALKEAKGGMREVAMDIALFRPVESIDYAPMNDPVVLWYFDRGAKEMVPDFEVSDTMYRTVDKLYRKSEKMALRASN